MRTILFTLSAYSIFFLAACNEQVRTSEDAIDQQSSVNDVDTVQNEFEEVGLGADLATCINIHNQVYPIDLPFKANFVLDKYEGYFPLEDDEKVSFSLDKAGLDIGSEIYLEGFMELSMDYLSYVFVTYPSQNEISTYLVTYEPDYTFADALEIGYDEAAEGFTFKESTIDSNGIQMKVATYFEEEEIEQSNYVISETGKISPRDTP